MAVTYKDVEGASVILVVGLDAEQEVPILHLRLRRPPGGARIWVVHPRRTRLHDVATHVLCAPGDEASLLAGGADAVVDEALAALREASGDSIVLGGSVRVPPRRRAVADAAGARFQYVTRRGNDRGALIAGVHPTLLPGGRSMAEVDDVERVWGPLMNREPGRDTLGILRACVDGEIDVLFLIGVDPLRDMPDAALVRRALDDVPVKVVQSLELGSLGSFADAFLPASAFLEKDGHVSSWEGRGQRLRAIRGREGISLADWEIFASMALAAAATWVRDARRAPRRWDGSWGRAGGATTTASAPPEEGEPVLIRTGHVGRLGRGPDPQPDWERARGDQGATDEIDLALRTSVRRATRAGPRKMTLGGLVLFTYPLLVDEGRLSERADELKAALEDEAFVELHPRTRPPCRSRTGAGARAHRGRGGRAAGAGYRARRGRRGVPFNQPGLPANTLLSGQMLARSRVSPVEGSASRRQPWPSDRTLPRGPRRPWRRRRLMDWVDWTILVVQVVIVFFALLIAVMLYIWMERKVIADMQTRVGPMRAGPAAC